ncbi:PQQ-dependent sugar dehydrogenase [Micromonospora yangpuensis]|uniref:Glucose/arabinose dehydrogenase, beta-propeller fold n=1 Tax=Micromonospora yangpuensis TaxID=683228 RepID=A0A1C6UW62_9ACTN|nr:PQQ-dependent sugar dehydrogenase [Micromonospora yangpuensis]GGM25658.1 glucose dehydrogenase [Micromonospora yangpuensis]SCL58206.1 Glucose/arabinose dehydrogenase, beta-propeller fold [Micromonospora yangpuensis]
MSRWRRHPAPALAGLLVLVLSALLLPPTSAAGTSPTRAAVPLTELTVVSEQVATGLRRPIALTGLPDGRMLIAEKNGTVRAYHPDTGLATQPVLDLTARIDTSGNERGLLGITPAPNFARTGMLYVAYTSLPAGALTLARLPIGAPERLQVLLTQEHAEYNNHNGGQVAFGRDGYLYWSLGDGGHTNDPYKAGQDLSTLLGKIVRIDVNRNCGAKPYCVPASNPFVQKRGARPEIWLYGLRNPWRFSVDPVDGSLWIGDVGQGLVEEINHIRPSQGGANLGWSCREGTPVFDPAQCRPGVVYTDPVFEYEHFMTESCSVTGGVVYRGSATPEARGTYIASDYCSTLAFAVRPKPTGGYETATIGRFPTQPTAIDADARGELYVLSDLPGWLSRVRFERVAGDGAANR